MKKFRSARLGASFGLVLLVGTGCLPAHEGVTLQSARSENQEVDAPPAAKPSPSPTGVPSPRPSVSPSPRPSITPSPSPSPRPSPSPSPSPRPSPKPSVTPPPVPPVGSADCVPSTIAGKGTTTIRPLGSTPAPYGFIEYLPPGYSATAGKRWPLIVMLHGSGERGDGKSNVAKAGAHGPNRRIREGREFPAVIITPQTASSWNAATLDSFVAHLFANYRLDPDRFYLTGLSLGGGGAWNYLRQHPERLAATIVVCGYASANNSTREREILASRPLYVVHNLDDGSAAKYTLSLSFADSLGAHVGAKNDALTGYEASGKTLDTTSVMNYATKEWEFDPIGRQLRDAKGALRSATRTIFTFPRKGGHDAWTKTYQAEDTWNWLFCQKR